MKKILTIIIAALAVLSSCDKLEDTYKEFAGDGPIRYAGKCKDIKIMPGWMCLRASWGLSDDPTVRNIIVKCISEGDTITQTLPASATEAVIPDLKNKNYRVTVQSQASDGALSICDAITERPYTPEHESVQAFTRGVNKAFLTKNNLILFMGTWEEGIEDFHIEYTATDNTAKNFNLTKEVFESKYVDVKNVDTSKPVVLRRTGWIEGCPDLIEFSPYNFVSNIAMNSDFRSNLQQRYGVTLNNLGDFVKIQNTVELDNDLYSLEDLFYFSDLKSVKLGKNHYFDTKYIVSPTVEQKQLASWVLKELNAIYGTKVEIYSDAYLDASENAPYITRMGNSVLPKINCLDTTGWKITNSEEDENNEFLKDLLDDNQTTSWTSWPSTTGIRPIQLTVDMGKTHTVHGVKIVQPSSSTTKNFLQGTVKVEYYADGAWKNLGFIDDLVVGKARGEATLIPAAIPVSTSQIRITIKEVTYKSQVKVALADIAIY